MYPITKTYIVLTYTKYGHYRISKTTYTKNSTMDCSLIMQAAHYVINIFAKTSNKNY